MTTTQITGTVTAAHTHDEARALVTTQPRTLPAQVEAALVTGALPIQVYVVRTDGSDYTVAVPTRDAGLFAHVGQHVNVTGREVSDGYISARAAGFTVED